MRALWISVDDDGQRERAGAPLCWDNILPIIQHRDIDVPSSAMCCIRNSAFIVTRDVGDHRNIFENYLVKR